MATPVFQAAGTAVTSTGAALSVAWPTHLTDDIALLVIESSGGSAAQGAIAGWTEVASSPQTDVATAAGSKFQVFWRRATSAAEANVATSVRTDHQLGRIYTFRGCVNTGSPIHIEAGTASGSASTTATSPGFITTNANCLVVAMISRPSDSAATNHFSSPTNASLATVTARGEAGTIDGDGGGYGCFTGTKATAGTVGAWSVTKGTSTTWCGISIALCDVTGTSIVQTITDAVGILNNSMTQTVVAAQTIIDPVGITDPQTQVSVTARTATDPVGIADSYGADTVRPLTDPVGILDSIVQNIGTQQTIIDPIGIVDSQAQASAVVQVVTDLVGIVDSQAAATARTLTDPVGILDTMVQNVGTQQTITDPVGIVDSYSAATVRLLTDSIGITDLMAQVSAASQAITDLVGILDSYGAATARVLTDAVGILDLIVQNSGTAQVITDVVGILDSTTQNSGTAQVITDPIGIVDSYSAGQARTLVDVLGLLDSTSQISQITQTIIDAVGLIDSQARQMTRVLTDPVGISDSVQAVLALARTITDLLGVLDSSTASVVTANLSAYWGIDMTP